MAEYDGSIRIGVKVDEKNAEKQLEILKKRLQSQTLEIDKQAKAAGKLGAKLKEMAQKTGKPEFVEELVTGIAEAEAKAAELDRQIKEMNAAEPGGISAENAQKMQELIQQLAEADAKSDQLKASLSELGLKPTLADNLIRTAQEMLTAERNVDRLKDSIRQTNEQITQTQADSAGARQGLEDIGNSARVSSQYIIDLRDELAELNKRKQDLEAAGVGLGFQEYDDTVARIQEINAELKDYQNGLNESGDATSTWRDRLKSVMGSVKEFMASAAKKAGNAVKDLGKHITALGKNKGFEKAHKNASILKKLTKPLQKLGSMIRRVFVFSVITSGLRSIREGIGKYLSVNTQFMDALDGIKSNLLTAFQPIYEAVMPALTKLIETLKVVSAKFASFIAMIFGTTASQAQQNAKDLYEQANAEEAVGDAAEDAEKKQKKFLASFDTIQKIGEEETETKKEKATDDQKDKLKFDTNFEEFQPPQWLVDFWKVFQDSWNQYGETTIEAFKFAMEGLKAAALALGEAFMTVWTDGTGLAFLNQIQLLLQEIFYLIGNIGQTFAQVWSSGAGVAILTEMFRILTTMLAIMTSMAASFNQVWTSGAGEAVLTALFALLATILGIIGDIASAFLEAWDSGAGTAAISAIMFAITAVLTLLNSVGQAFRDAWNDDGLGVQIWTDIINIIGGAFDIIGKLANRFTEAWEANENGKAIWTAILQIIKDVTAFFDRLVQATVEWASWLDLEPIVSGFRSLMETVEPLVNLLLEGLSWAWENVLLPLASWQIEESLPAGIELLTTAFQALTDILTALQPLFMVLWETILKPLASFIGSTFISAINNLAQAIQAIASIISSFIEMVSNAAKEVQNFFGGSKSATNGISSSKSSGFSGRSYSAQTYSAAPMTYNVGGETPNAAMRLLSNPEFVTMSASPRMARGVETTPNSEYVASGAGKRNDGSGISMAELEQALTNVISRQGGGNTKVDVNFTGSLAQLARVLQPEISVETQRLGPDLVGV